MNLDLLRGNSLRSKRTRNSSFGTAKTSTLLVLVGSLLLGVVGPLPIANAATRTTPSYVTATTTTSVILDLPGATLKAAPLASTDFTFAGTDAARFSIAGVTFTRTSNTRVTITGLTSMAGGTNNTIAVPNATHGNSATSASAAAVLSDITSPAYVTASTTTSVTITLSSGSGFKAGTIVAADFTFAGTDAARFSAGGAVTFTRTSNTVVTVTGLTSMTGGSNNTVLVKAATMLAQNGTVTGAAVLTTISTAGITGVTAPVTGATPVTSITNTQYTGTIVWSGGNPATFAAGVAYSATITLTPTAGFTLNGVSANFFTVAGTTGTTNAINDGVVTTGAFATTSLLAQATLSITSLGTSTKASPYSQALSITTSGGSGTGAVTYAIFAGGTAATCALSNATSTATITATTAGTCLIQATKAADSTYASATSASATFTFTLAAQSALSISLDIATAAAGANQAITITPTGGSGTGATTYAILAGGTATGCTLANATATNSITATTAGTC